MELSPHITCLSSAIVSLCSPEKIYLFHAKVNLSNQITSFKICVVADTPSKVELERKIYLELDCELPYDLVLYTPSEWTNFLSEPHSFASEVVRKGALIYDKTKTSCQSF